jgi:hypothetical protein
MSSRNFKSLNRAYRRGHITIIQHNAGRTTLVRTTKSTTKAWIKDVDKVFHGKAQGKGFVVI